MKKRMHGLFLFCSFILALEMPRLAPAAETVPAGGASGFFGASNLTNPNISLVLDSRVYGSNLSNDDLAAKGIEWENTNGLEMKRGFNLASAELFFFSPVDPYFNLYVNLPVTEAGVEVEEAHAVSTSLPAGLQVKLGRFKSNITRLDAQHPHAWDFTDMALPYRAFMGPEGLGGENGVQVTCLPSLPFYLLLGAESLQGENTLVLNGDAWQGPQAYTGFMKTSLDTGDLSTLYFGPWVLAGQTRSNDVAPNATVTGQSVLTGVEAVWKWKPQAGYGWQVQSEYMHLRQQGGIAGASGLEGSLLRCQDGVYLQAVCQRREFRFAARYDRLALFDDRFAVNGEQQDMGANPWRASVNFAYQPDEFANLRLQYTHDASARNGVLNREWMLQFIYAIGAHAAHTF